MSLQLEIYKIAIGDLGEAEVPGVEDNPKIKLAHKLCGIVEGQTFGTDIDKIPWCSSMMNLWTFIVLYRLNDSVAMEILNKKWGPELTQEFIKEMRDLYPESRPKLPSTQIGMPLPTFSAAAISWRNWGLATTDPQIGDLVVTTRKGGHHVGLLQAKDLLTVTLLGANQGDKVSMTSKFLKTQVVSYRRATLV